MAFEDILFEVGGNVATITINRPEKRNALRGKSFDEVTQAVLAAGADPAVRTIVITGKGDKAFCAGGDINMAKDFHDNLPAARAHAVHRMLGVSNAICAVDKPVIGAVNGIAVGGGAELLCFCDFVIAADHAEFWFNGTDLGGCSWWGGPQLLPIMVGLRRAEEILYWSRRFSAAEAVEWGFANRAVPREGLMEEVGTIASRFGQMAYNGLRLTKSTLRMAREAFLVGQNAIAEMNAPAMAGSDIFSKFAEFRGQSSR